MGRSKTPPLIKSIIMSLDQINSDIVNRQELQQLSEKQLLKLLSIPVKQQNDCHFTKENLIEMYLTQQQPES